MRSPGLPSSIALVRDGYAFVGKRCERDGTDGFSTRLLGRPLVFIRGREAAQLFYGDDRLVRDGAFPRRALRTLLGTGSVQTLDGEPHRHRKQMFLSLLEPPAIDPLVDLVTQAWRRRLDQWERCDLVVLHDQVAEVLCEAVCDWAGVPVSSSEVPHRTAQLLSLIESPIAVGPKHWRGRIARRRLEHWASELVERARQGGFVARPGSALDVVARHRDLDGAQLDRHTAAVELLNVLRPTVALARFVVFCALALHHFPRWAAELQHATDAEREMFVQEVRRTTPFFPMSGAKARTAFDWHGIHVPRGRLVLLDLYGTDHDPASWPDPDHFDPGRMSQWDGDAFDLVPQGAGDHAANHRCPGEWLTIGVMKEAVRLLLDEMSYDVPGQDLSVSLRRVPALPASGFVIADVRRAAGS